jgi:hypothetical protein
VCCACFHHYVPLRDLPTYLLIYFSPVVRFVIPLWARNVRVGENSPSLCPTIFSVTYTGTNLLPLCTAIVCPTISGMIVERRDHVRIARFSALFSIARILSSGAHQQMALFYRTSIASLLVFPTPSISAAAQ